METNPIVTNEIIGFLASVISGAVVAIFTAIFSNWYKTRKRRDELTKEFPDDKTRDLLRQLGASKSNIRIIKGEPNLMEIMCNGQWQQIGYDNASYRWLTQRGYVRSNVDLDQDRYWVHGITELGHQKASELSRIFGKVHTSS